MGSRRCGPPRQQRRIEMLERLTKEDLDHAGLEDRAVILEGGCALGTFVTASPILIDPATDTFQFKGQKGPIKEVGVNGAQVDDILRVASAVIGSLDRAFPCDENKKAVRHIDLALKDLAARTKRRTKAGTEGTSEEDADAAPAPAPESDPEPEKKG